MGLRCFLRIGLWGCPAVLSAHVAFETEACREQSALEPGTALQEDLLRVSLFRGGRKESELLWEDFLLKLFFIFSVIHKQRRSSSSLFSCLKMHIHLKHFCPLVRFSQWVCAGLASSEAYGLAMCVLLRPIVRSSERSTNDLQRKNLMSSVDCLFVCNVPASLKFFTLFLSPSSSNAFPAVCHHSIRPATCQHQQLCSSDLLLVSEPWAVTAESVQLRQIVHSVFLEVVPREHCVSSCQAMTNISLGHSWRQRKQNVTPMFVVWRF